MTGRHRRQRERLADTPRDDTWVDRVGPWIFVVMLAIGCILIAWKNGIS